MRVEGNVLKFSSFEIQVFVVIFGMYGRYGRDIAQHTEFYKDERGCVVYFNL